MTSEEIVKALREDCKTCSENSVCRNGLNLVGLYCGVKDAADLIERLEKEKAALLESIRGGCMSCKYWLENTIDCKIFDGCTSCKEDCKCRGCEFGSNWEWKGLEDSK